MDDNIKELRKRVVSEETFVAEAMAVHGERYDYGRVGYRNLSSSVIVGCAVHGDFEVMGREHLEGKGCPKCAKGEKYIEKLKEKFGDKFGLEEFVYESTTKPITLICPKHGRFTGMPGAIIATRCGCPECGKDMREEEVNLRAFETEHEKEERRRTKQAEMDSFYEKLGILTRTEVDDKETFVDKVVCLLSGLDEKTLDDVISRLQEIRGDVLVQHSGIDLRASLPSSFVGIDFETLYPQRVSACSVGMVKYKDGVMVDKYYTLIRPPFDYPGKKGNILTWIHGFTEDDVRYERTFEELLPEMEAFAEGLPLVAHFAGVERACIRDTAMFYNVQTSLNYDNIIDTYALSLEIERSMGVEIKGEGTHTLDVVCRRFNVPELTHHNALDDAEMAGNLLLAFKEILEGKEFDFNTSATKKRSEKYNPSDKIQRRDLENVANNPFKDCVVVLTGFAKVLSQEYGHKLKYLGAKISVGVSKKTQWLICGPNAGPSKMEKAREVGAQIISEEEFLSLIQNIE